MTMTMERPIVDNLFVNFDDQQLKDLISPTIAKLVALDELAWQTQLEGDGFTAGQVSALKACVREWTDLIDVDDLSKRLMSVRDIRDDAEIIRVLDTWAADVSMSSSLAGIAQADFPMPLDAVCYAVGHVRALTYATLEFETMRRELEAGPEKDFSMTPEQMAEGVKLAESGLAEDSKTWPVY